MAQECDSRKAFSSSALGWTSSPTLLGTYWRARQLIDARQYRRAAATRPECHDDSGDQGGVGSLRPPAGRGGTTKRVEARREKQVMAAASSVRKAIPADAPRLALALALALASAFQDDPSSPGCSPTSNTAALSCRPTWSRRMSGTSPCTAATASRSRPRSSFRVVQGSGPCGARPAVAADRWTTSWTVARGTGPGRVRLLRWPASDASSSRRGGVRDGG
jgi:hypothetical protein